ncbi:MAG: N-acetylglucosamine kinase [Flavobacteriaceae bacterium]
MILIADSGSTKCDWVILDSSGEVILKTTTLGLNPAILLKDEINSIINSNAELASVFSKITTLDFYGAGCGTEIPRQNLEELLSIKFTNAKVTVQEDMIAAVLSVTTEPAIVCILGTGSNSCYFDGTNINQAMPSLGYMIMDEASGNYYGKQLIQDYYFDKMPWEIALKFNEEYRINSDEIKTNLYKKPNPNAYLASFAKFIFNTQDQDYYFYNMLTVGISKFLNNHIFCYYEAKQVPIHFIGSIAHFSEDVIKESFKNHNLKLGKIIRKPIDGLIEYYRNNKL